MTRFATHQLKPHPVRGAIWAGAAIAALASGARAQEAPTAVDEVVVTAQRREERLQDVPIAISAIGASQLAAKGVSDIADLRGTVPGLAISGFGGVNASNLISIRGISGQPLPIGAGQATAIYLDGVYLSRPDAGFFALDDVARIEVLRGPQGTLYGRNATAGAINIVTRDPGATLEGGVDVSFGRFAALKAKGSLSGPISDHLAIGVSGSYEDRKGYFTNPLTGLRIGERESFTVRGKARYERDDGRFDATLTVDFSGVEGADFLKNLNAGTTFIGLGDPKLIPTDVADRARLDMGSSGQALVMNAKLGESWTLTSITSRRRQATTSIYDGDGSALTTALTAGDNHSRTFTQEVRGLYGGERLRATLGANYYRETARFGLSITPSRATIAYTNPFDTTKLDAWAAFSQVEFDLTPRLTAVAGLRFNSERRDYTVDYRQAPSPGRFQAGTLSDDALIPSVGLNFKVTPDVLLYAKAGQGYQAPGFNFAPGAAAANNVFSAEKLWSYEVGAKTQSFDRRLTANIAAFYYDYQDLQIRSVTSPGVTFVDNAASASVKGIEGEIVALVAASLTLSGQLSYTDGHYREYCQILSIATPQGADPLCRPNFADRSGNRLNQSPKWAGGLTLDYHRPISETLNLSLVISYSFESNVYFNTINEPAASSGGWDRVDARLGLHLRDGPELYLYGRNLADERHVAQVFRLSPASVLAAVSEPATYGVGVRQRF